MKVFHRRTRKAAGQAIAEVLQRMLSQAKVT